MKFYPASALSLDSSVLEQDYRSAHEVGVIRAGTSALFFRSRFKTYYVPYEAICRCFRRVQEVPAKMCCGEGNFAVENLVVCDDMKELAVIQLPGTKAARLLLEELKGKIPHAVFRAQEKAPSEKGEEA